LLRREPRGCLDGTLPAERLLSWSRVSNCTLLLPADKAGRWVDCHVGIAASAGGV